MHFRLITHNFGRFACIDHHTCYVAGVAEAGATDEKVGELYEGFWFALKIKLSLKLMKIAIGWLNH